MAQALTEFQMLVLRDNDLQQKLRGCLDRSDFVSLVIKHAREHGFAVTAGEVDTAMNASLQAWVMRWLDR
jgi:hypothetical protein